MPRPHTEWGRILLRGIFAAALPFMSASPSVGLVCTDQEIQSKSAEKCAKKYSAVLRKCLKKGIPLQLCDFTASDKFCGQLSQNCAMAEAADNLLTIVYSVDTPADTSALACTAQDIDSENAIRCAKKHSAAIRRCAKQGILPEACDTSRSETFCSQLSAGCIVSNAVETQIAAVFGAGSRPDQCLAAYFKGAANVLGKRASRRRSAKGEKLVDDLQGAFETLTDNERCTSVPTLQGACAAAATLDDAAACVLGEVSDCLPIPMNEVRSAAETTFAYAENLGWIPAQDSSLRCANLKGESFVHALFRNGGNSPGLDVAVFGQSEDNPLPLIAASTSEGGAMIFNEVGGVTVSRNGDSSFFDAEGQEIGVPPVSGFAGVMMMGAQATQSGHLCSDYWYGTSCRITVNAVDLASTIISVRKISLLGNAAVTGLKGAKAWGGAFLESALADLAEDLFCTNGTDTESCSNPSAPCDQSICDKGRCIVQGAPWPADEPCDSDVLPQCVGDRIHQAVCDGNLVHVCAGLIKDCPNGGVCIELGGEAECFAVQECGNDSVELGEECDGSADAACPGECVPPGQIGECTCNACLTTGPEANSTCTVDVECSGGEIPLSFEVIFGHLNLGLQADIYAHFIPPPEAGPLTFLCKGPAQTCFITPSDSHQQYIANFPPQIYDEVKNWFANNSPFTVIVNTAEGQIVSGCELSL